MEGYYFKQEHISIEMQVEPGYWRASTKTEFSVSLCKVCADSNHYMDSMYGGWNSQRGLFQFKNLLRVLDTARHHIIFLIAVFWFTKTKINSLVLILISLNMSSKIQDIHWFLSSRFIFASGLWRGNRQKVMKHIRSCIFIGI